MWKAAGSQADLTWKRSGDALLTQTYVQEVSASGEEVELDQDAASLRLLSVVPHRMAHGSQSWLHRAMSQVRRLQLKDLGAATAAATAVATAPTIHCEW